MMLPLGSLDPSTLPTDHEVGAQLFASRSGGLFVGPMAQGYSHDGVDIPLAAAPDGYSFAGTIHTHPGGPADPSPADMYAARNTGQQLVCVIVPETGEMVCRRI